MSDILFNAEIHDAGRYNEIQEQRAAHDDYGDELDELDESQNTTNQNHQKGQKISQS